MIHVANPIYDSVFKYLLEDERAASDTEIRQRMNIEEEIYTALENRDTEIMQTKKLVAEQAQQLTQQAQELSQLSSQLSAAVQALSESGMPRDMIAATLGITPEFVNSVLRQ